MRGDIVLVRAYEWKPLERKVWSIGKTTIMLSNPVLFESIEAGKAWPMGFPIEDVFQFDEGLYKQLIKAYERGAGEKLIKLWAKGTPYLESLALVTRDSTHRKSTESHHR
jgi:hypothetical protein